LVTDPLEDDARLPGEALRHNNLDDSPAAGCNECDGHDDQDPPSVVLHVPVDPPPVAAFAPSAGAPAGCTDEFARPSGAPTLASLTQNRRESSKRFVD